MVDESTTQQGTQMPEDLATKLKERGFESIDDLLADRDTIAEERDKFQERHSNAEKLVQRQGAELGQLRKVAGVTPGASAEPQAGDTDTQEQTVEQTLASVEQALSQEQKDAAEAAFKNATEEERVKFATDPAAKLQLLKHVQASVRVVPETLFGSPSSDTGAAGTSVQALSEDRIKELFQTERNRSSYYPAGSGGGPSGGSGGVERVSNPRPVGTGGVLNAIERRNKS